MKQAIRPGYRPELDGLRTLAITGVLFFHATVLLPFKLWGGSFGVDLFFVLSGLLITTLLLQEHDRTGGIDLRDFYLRRVLRLVPAMLVFIALAFWVQSQLPGPHDAGTNLPLWQSAIVAFFGVSNWFLTTPERLGMLAHTWSLAIEWQFYLVWPAVLIIALRRTNNLQRLALIVAGGAVASAATRALVFQTLGPTKAIFWTISHADGVLLGSALALAIAGGSRIVNVIGRTDVALAAAALAGLGVANLQLGQRSVYLVGLFALVVCFAIVIGHVAVRGDGWIARFLRLPPLPQLGRISYGIYLFHVLVNAYVLFHDATRRTSTWMWIAMLCSIGIATLSYLAVERPALKLRKVVQRRRARTAEAALVVQ